MNRFSRINCWYFVTLAIFLLLNSYLGYGQNVLDRVGLNSSSLVNSAYSLRKLSSSYSGSAIRVRRTSDNTESDIGFTAQGNLDTTALKSFVWGSFNPSNLSNPLDNLSVSAAAAYSLRKLRAAYTGPAIRVRRSSDNTESNIGFLNGELDQAALLTFVGSNNGFVTVWYDQSVNGRNLTQTTAANQPQIVSSGTVILSGTKPILSFTSSSQNIGISAANWGMALAQPFTRNAVMQPPNTVGSGTRVASSQATWGSEWYNQTTSMQMTTNTGAGPDIPISANERLLFTAMYNSSSSYMTKNGSIVGLTGASTIGTNPMEALRLNSLDGGAAGSQNKFQEFIVFGSTLSGNDKFLLEANQGNYYNIITTYFNAFVTKWYDQSGNNKDVSQSTSSLQPRIVKNGNVDLSNSKPTINSVGIASTLVNPTSSSIRQISAIAALNSTANTISGLVGETGNDLGIFTIYGASIIQNQAIGFPHGSGAGTYINGGISTLSGTNPPLPSTYGSPFVLLSQRGSNYNFSSFSIGYYFVPARYWDGTTSEIITFGSLLSSASRSSLILNQGLYYGVAQSDLPPIISNKTDIVCSGSNFSLTPVSSNSEFVPSGITYSWSAPTMGAGLTGGVSGSSSGTISGNLINTSSSRQTAIYTITATNNSSTGTNSSTFTYTVSVDPESVGGTINSNSTSLNIGSSATLSLTGNVGTISTWQSSYNLTDWTNISSSSTNTITTSSISQTTHFRAIVTSGECIGAYSNVFTIHGIEVTGSNSYTYNGLPQGPVDYTTSSTSSVTFTYTSVPSGTYSSSTRPISVGTYTARASVLSSNSSVNINSLLFTFTISPAPLTVTLPPQNKTYGLSGSTSGVLNATYSVTGLQNTDAAGTISLTYSGSPSGHLPTAPVGSYTVTASGLRLSDGNLASGNYSITYLSGTLNVNAAPLTITALAQTKVYGVNLSTTGVLSTTYSITGLMNGEQVGTLILTYSSNSQTSTTSVGTYSILPSGLTLSGGAFIGNYSITYLTGTLNVNAAPLTVTALTQNKVYGTTVSTNGILSSTFTVTGLVNGEQAGTLNLSYSGNPAGNLTAANAGTYSILPSGLTLTAGASLGNYSITYLTGTLNVNAAPLTVTALTQNKVYGTTVSTNGILSSTFTVTGLVNGEQAGTLNLSYSGNPAGNLTAANAGTYSILPSGLTLTAGASSNNYSITYINGQLNVTKAESSIDFKTTTPNKYSYQNIQLGPNSPDVITVGSTSAVIFNYSGTTNSTTYSSTTRPINVGTYNVIATLPSDNNHESSSATFNFEITPATLTIVASDITINYGDQISSAPYTITGLINGHSLSNVIDETGVSFLTNYTSNSNAGTSSLSVVLQNINRKNTTEGNSYAELIYIPGRVTVRKANLTIMPLAQSKEYGETTLTSGVLGAVYSATGLKNNENLNDEVTLSSNGFISTAVVGTYTITLSVTDNVKSSNYSITILPTSVLTVNRAPVIISPVRQTKVYGSTLSTNGIANSNYTVTGLKNSEVLDVTLSSIGGTTTATVGTYNDLTVVINSNSISSNYSITVNGPGDLEVTKAQLTIAGESQIVPFGTSTNTVLQNAVFSVTGFVNGENVGVLSQTASFATNYSPIIDAGTNGISLSPPVYVSNNYSFIRSNGVITIQKAPLVVTINNQTKIFGETLTTLNAPASLISVSGLKNDDSANTINLVYGGTPAGNLPSASVGTYSINGSGLTLSNGKLSNYTISYASSTLVIAKAPLSVVGPTISVTYGDIKVDIESRPEYKFTSSGYKNSDTQEIILTGVKLKFVYLSTNQALSEIPIEFSYTPNSASWSNYDVRFIPGKITINKAVLRIKAVADNICEGTTRAELLNRTSVEAVGYKNRETYATSVTGQVVNFVTNYVDGIVASNDSKIFIIPDLSLASSTNYTLVADTTYVSFGKLAKINSITQDALCSDGVNIFNYTPLNGVDGTIPSGTKYTWRISNNNFIGGATNNLTPVDILGGGQKLVNSSNAIVGFTYFVTPVNNGCQGSEFVLTVKVKPLPVVDQVSDISICFGTEKAVNFSGSTLSGTQYVWSNSNSNIGLASDGIGNLLIKSTKISAKAIESIIKVRALSNGCYGAEKSFKVQVKPTPGLPDVVNSNQSICIGNLTKPIVFNDSLGSTINWSTNYRIAGLQQTGVGTVPAFLGVNSNSTPLNLTFTVTPELNGCQGPSAILATVNINTPVFSQIDTYPAYACLGSTVGPFKVDKSTGGDFYTYDYKWQVSTDSTNYTTIPNSLSYRLIAPAQTKTAWYRVVTESGGCTAFSTPVKVPTREKPKVNISLATSSATVGIGNSLQVFASGADSYEWTPKLDVSNPFISNPLLSPKKTSVFTVKGIDLYGCIGEDNLLVTVDENGSITPNVIVTPNGDNVNDTWEIKNIQYYPKNSIQLYDSQGILIKQFDNYTGGWNATINDVKLPVGNYYYVISLNEDTSVSRGFVTILY